MTVGDYVRLADREIDFNAPDERDNRWRSLLKTSFDIPLWAVQDAQLTPGRRSCISGKQEPSMRK
jgi:hypothetical protein